MGELVGVAKPTVDAWEHRGTRPAPEALRKVVEFLGYEPGAAATPDDLVQRLAEARRRLRLPRSEAAELIGVSYGAVHTWETGRRRPRGRSLMLLEEFIERSKKQGT